MRVNLLRCFSGGVYRSTRLLSLPDEKLQHLFIEQVKNIPLVQMVLPHTFALFRAFSACSAPVIMASAPCALVPLVPLVPMPCCVTLLTQNVPSIVSQTTITCMETICRNMEAENAVSQLVVGTEHRQVHVFDTSGTKILQTVSTH